MTRWATTSFSLPSFACCWVVWTAVSNMVSPNKRGRTCKVIMKYHAAVLLTVSFAVAYNIHPTFTLSFVSRQGGCRAICTKNTHLHILTCNNVQTSATCDTPNNLRHWNYFIISDNSTAFLKHGVTWPLGGPEGVRPRQRAARSLTLPKHEFFAELRRRRVHKTWHFCCRSSTELDHTIYTEHVTMICPVLELL